MITVSIVAQIVNVFLSPGRAACEMVKNLEPSLDIMWTGSTVISCDLMGVSYLTSKLQAFHL